MEDDLEADIRAAIESSSSDAASPASVAGAGSDGQSASSAPAAPQSATAVTEAPKASEPVRGEDGKFKAKDQAQPAAAQAQPKAETTPATSGTEPAKTDPVKEAISPPANWKGAGKVEWNRLPKAVQQEISQDYARTTETQTKLSQLESAIGPERAQVLSATYGSVGQGLQNLFAISDLATKNPTGFVLWFAQQRGINLAQMVGQATEQGQQPAQAPDPVMQRLSQLETFIQTNLQQQQQSATAPILSEIQRFSSDPANPWFNDVADDINALLKENRVKGASPSERLKNAYDMACWANPEVREKLIEDQKQQILGRQSEVAKNALNASSSISGSPAGAQIANQEPNETLEQTITRLVMASRS